MEYSDENVAYEKGYEDGIKAIKKTLLLKIEKMREAGECDLRSIIALIEKNKYETYI